MMMMMCAVEETTGRWLAVTATHNRGAGCCNTVYFIGKQLYSCIANCFFIYMELLVCAILTIELLRSGMGWMPEEEKNPSVIYENWLNDKGEVMPLFCFGCYSTSICNYSLCFFFVLLNMETCMQ